MPVVRLLVFSTLYPNAAQPNHGIFVENRLRHLVGSGAVAASVVAPVPYFPSASPRFGDWARYARAPRLEERHGITVRHPRYPVLPRIGMSVAPILLYRAIAPWLARQIRAGVAFEAIDAHYLYPDGVAAIGLGRRFGVPVVLTARGSDVTQLPDHAIPRRWIERALGRAAHVITVSAALREGVIALGAAPDRVTVLRNGIDTALFRPCDRAGARAAHGLVRKTVISVGHLIARKRHHLTIAAMALLPDADLLIVGDGPERGALSAEIAALGLGDRVRLFGSVDHADLPPLYSAADVMVLASSREGWANVLLEAMACGTPAVALRIGGNAEVIQAPEAGLIVDEATPEAIAAALRALFASPPDRAATRAYAERFGWEATTRGQLDIFGRILRRDPMAAQPSSAITPTAT